MVVGLLLLIFLETLIGGIVVWVAYDIILCSIFATLPVISYWACVGIAFALSLIKSFFGGGGNS